MDVKLMMMMMMMMNILERIFAKIFSKIFLPKVRLVWFSPIFCSMVTTYV